MADNRKYSRFHGNNREFCRLLYYRNKAEQWRCDTFQVRTVTSKRLASSAARKSALAVAFSASSGIPVASATRSIALLREMEEALRETGTEVAAHAADVGSPDGAARLIEVTVAAHLGIDILVNNVGGGGVGARVADSTDDTGGSPR